MTDEMTTYIEPLADRVIVQPIDEGEQKYGSIVIPENAKEKPQQGEVVAVGPGKTMDNGICVPVGVSKGDRVLYGKYSGMEVTVDGEDFLVLRESDVLGIMVHRTNEALHE